MIVRVVADGHEIVEINWERNECTVLRSEAHPVVGAPEPLSQRGWGFQQRLDGGFGAQRHHLSLEMIYSPSTGSETQVSEFQMVNFEVTKKSVDDAAWDMLSSTVLSHCELLGLPESTYPRVSDLPRRARVAFVEMTLQQVWMRNACPGGDRKLIQQAQRCAYAGRCERLGQAMASGDYCVVELR